MSVLAAANPGGRPSPCSTTRVPAGGPIYLQQRQQQSPRLTQPPVYNRGTSRRSIHLCGQDQYSCPPASGKGDPGPEASAHPHPERQMVTSDTGRPEKLSPSQQAELQGLSESSSHAKKMKQTRITQQGLLKMSLQEPAKVVQNYMLNVSRWLPAKMAYLNQIKRLQHNNANVQDTMKSHF